MHNVTYRRLRDVSARTLSHTLMQETINYSHTIARDFFPEPLPLRHFSFYKSIAFTNFARFTKLLS